MREELLLLISAQLGQGFISKKHYRLVDGLLPKPAPLRRGRGHPRGAGGKSAFRKSCMLCHDWIIAKANDRSLTKEQFARARCGVTDQDLKGELSLEYRARVDAVLQELKPARIKRLDQKNRVFDSFIPLALATPGLRPRMATGKATCAGTAKRRFFAELFWSAEQCNIYFSVGGRYERLP